MKIVSQMSRILVTVIVGTFMFSGPCWGMLKRELTDDEVLSVFAKEFRRRECAWWMITHDIEEYPHLRQQFEIRLLDADITDLNQLKFEYSLFEALYDAYRKSKDEPTKNFYRTILKKLILKGLDFKHAKSYRYEQEFWHLFNEIIRENPAQAAELSHDFEDQIATRKKEIEAQEEKQKIIEEEKIIQQQIQHMLHRRKKLQTFGFYFCVGCVGLAILYVIYQKCWRSHVDNQGIEDLEQENETDGNEVVI